MEGGRFRARRRLLAVLLALVVWPTGCSPAQQEVAGPALIFFYTEG
ncbi:MAG TPA: hypothetical protein VNL77_03625 [Roseiflexaceae bacterium]|nr:hypothetical protein [Roseiflexaceae bacterium]